MEEIYEEELVDEGVMLKERLREARDTRKSITNQEIADQAGLSINTVNNYFASRTKSASVFTTGRLCRALHVSMDDVFGIIPDEDVEARAEHERQIAELQAECKHKDEIISLKDVELRRRRLLIYVVLSLCLMMTVFLLGYLCFDAANPYFGLFRR